MFILHKILHRNGNMNNITLAVETLLNLMISFSYLARYNAFTMWLAFAHLVILNSLWISYANPFDIIILSN